MCPPNIVSSALRAVTHVAAYLQRKRGSSTTSVHFLVPYGVLGFQTFKFGTEITESYIMQYKKFGIFFRELKYIPVHSTKTRGCWMLYRKTRKKSCLDFFLFICPPGRTIVCWKYIFVKMSFSETEMYVNIIYVIILAYMNRSKNRLRH